jgi:hypothetical protein
MFRNSGTVAIRFVGEGLEGLVVPIVRALVDCNLALAGLGSDGEVGSTIETLIGEVNVPESPDTLS